MSSDILTAMLWEEKIDRLKEEFDPADFKVPFTVGSTILKKIEHKFVVKEDSNLGCSSWDTRLKGKKKVNDLSTADVDRTIDKLDPRQNYWIVLTTDKADARYLVYDGKPAVIKTLWKLWGNHFYIVDKKYSWLVYFSVNHERIEVFKSGDGVTPFD